MTQFEQVNIIFPREKTTADSLMKPEKALLKLSFTGKGPSEAVKRKSCTTLYS